MSSSISALTAGGGGVVTSADSSGNLDLQSGTTTILALTSTGVAITGTLSATGVLSATSPTFVTPVIDSATVSTVSGTAPLYMCRAWVNFNGTGTVAIRASGNVSSITDNGTGDYTANLTTALVDANGSVVGGGFYFSGFNSSGEAVQCALSTTSAVRITTGSTAAKLDFNYVNISVFR